MNIERDKYPARLHLVVAAEAPLAVVFRRGPSRQVCTFLWNIKKDTFTIGQWLKGRIYERRSDLSPDGKYLLYFAMNGRWDSETKGSWTAVSRAPYLKAISLYKKGGCWEGGGLFLSKGSFWLNDRYFSDENTLVETTEVRRAGGYIPEGGYGGEVNGLYFNAEDTGVYYRRLLRDGWHYKTKNCHEQRCYIFEKQISKNCILRKSSFEGSPSKGRGCYWDEHTLIDTSSDIEIPCNGWEWADYFQDKLVYASKGGLYRTTIQAVLNADEPQLLHDFNGYTFNAIKAPY